MIGLAAEPSALITHTSKLPVRSLWKAMARPTACWRGAEAGLGRRLVRERMDPARRSPLVIERIVLEMLGLVAGARDADARRPPWIGTVVDRLHADPARRVTLDELAGAAGVHPRRLSRAFHRHLRMSVGEYVERLRVRHAEERLAEDGRPLAEIAIEAGFADQSHMTRVFRRVTGLTPGAARDAMRALKREDPRPGS